MPSACRECGTVVVRAVLNKWRMLSCVYADASRSKGRLPGMDIVRLLALLLVVIHHVNPVFCRFGEQSFQAFRGCGRLGVSLFIVLSGASLAINSFSNGVPAYYRKRLAAILPAYWFSYFVTAILLFMTMGRISMRGEWTKILQTAIGMDGFLMTQFKNYYLVGEWFVGFILVMYLVAPLVYKCLMRSPYATLAACFLISLASFCLSTAICSWCPLWNRAAHFNVTSRLFEFAFGMYFCKSVQRSLSLHGILAAVSVAYVALLVMVLKKSLLDISMWGICGQIAVFVCVTLPLGFITASSAKWKSALSWFSSLSFLAFLYHHRVIYLLESKLPIRNDQTYFVYFTITALFISYLLAHCSAPAVGVLKELVFHRCSGNGARNE